MVENLDYRACSKKFWTWSAKTLAKTDEDRTPPLVIPPQSHLDLTPILYTFDSIHIIRITGQRAD